MTETLLPFLLKAETRTNLDRDPYLDDPVCLFSEVNDGAAFARETESQRIRDLLNNQVKRRAKRDAKSGPVPRRYETHHSLAKILSRLHGQGPLCKDARSATVASVPLPTDDMWECD